MKKLLFLLILLGHSLAMYSQVTKTVNLTIAGTLSSTLTTSELATVTDLTITGNIDARDFKTMRDFMPVLAALNISNASIASYNHDDNSNRVPDYAFANKNSLISILLSTTVTCVGTNAFNRCTGLTTVNFGSNSSLATIMLGAFSGCSSLSSITIPESVTTIGTGAFGGCSGLNAITIPASVTIIVPGAFVYSSAYITVVESNQYYSSTDGVLFNKGKSELIQCPITKTGAYPVPSSVTTIKQGAFYACNSLTLINIPSSVTTIESSAFGEIKADIVVDENNSNYSNLDGVLFNKDKTELIKCPTSKAGKYEIPQSVNMIYPTAFGHCNDLTSITIPSSVNSIGADAFNPCNGLREIFVKFSTPLDLGTHIAFGVNHSACTLFVPIGTVQLFSVTDQWREFRIITDATKSVNSSQASINLTSPGLLSTILTSEELAIISKLTLIGTIDARDFKTMRDVMPALAEVDLSGATIVEYTGTEGTGGTGSITYPANEIPQYAFCTPGLVGKSSISSIKFPSAITSIGSYSLLYCTGLSTVSVPKSVFSIGRSAFNGCVGITSVIFESPSSLTTLGMYSFRGCSFPSIAIPSSVVNIVNGAFMACPNLASVEIGTSSVLTTIGTNAFRECPKLSAFVVPPSVSTIDNYAFLKCNNLTSVTFESPSSLARIGVSAFRECSELSSFTIPSSVTNIDDLAFYKSGITSFSIPAATVTMGTCVFLATNAFINVNTSNPNYSSQNGVLYDKNKTRLIYFPPITTGSFIIPSTVTSVAVDAFYNCSRLTSVTIPTGLTTLEEFAFEECKGLTTISLPASLIVIGTAAFYNCSSLTSIYANNPTPVDLSSKADVFFGINKSSCILYVPASSVNLYKAANQWKDFATIQSANQAPVADAGLLQTVNEGDLVTLDGSSSFDSNGDVLSYHWTAPEGITLSTTTSVRPTFVAPQVEKDTQFIFSLYVNDGVQNSANYSQVVITVKNIMQPPVANAGANQTVNEGELVRLDGSASSDPEGGTLSFTWTAPEGITLSSTTSQKPTFIAPEVKETQVFTISLTVSNGVASSTASVNISVKHVNKAPVANAGLPQTVNEKTMVTLNGSGSTDADGDLLTYSWTAPSGITLSDFKTSQPTFVAPDISTVTAYTFTLTVSDGTVTSTATTLVTVSPVVPYLMLTARLNGVLIPESNLHIQLFKKNTSAYDEKPCTYVLESGVPKISMEQGDWIVLVSPKDPKSFVPTYSGNSVGWESAQTISLSAEGTISSTIDCIPVTTIVESGSGEISGYVYSVAGLKSVSLINGPLDNGIPVSGALMQLFKKGEKIPVSVCFTDSKGFYLFDKIGIAEYEIVVELPGFKQSEKLPVKLSELTPSTVLYIAVNTTNQLITNTGILDLFTTRVYPNPFTGLLTIDLGTSAVYPTKISIYGVQGSLVFQKEVNNAINLFDLSEFVSGPYLIRIVSGNKIQSKILIKQ